MRFERLRIAGFGRLAGIEIEFGTGLTVVAGPNEAGKSTVVECLLRLLFGFPGSQFNKARKRYEPWQSGTPYAAMLRYRLDDGRVFEVARDFAKPDVPTETVEADTRRPVPALSGNKSASPGESVFQFSLDVYRRAAVVSAGDFAGESSNGAEHVLADRLAAIIGSAGDASAAEAIERLKKVHSDIGLSGPNTPLGKAAGEAGVAEAELRRFRNDHLGLADNIRRHAELTDRVHDLTALRARCAAALASVRLRSVRARITEAADAQQLLAAAMARRGDVVSASPKATARRDEVEAAAEALVLAEQAALDAKTRTSGRDAEKVAMQREIDGVGASLLEKRAIAARLDETIAAHETAAAGRPAISIETLAELEREADDADVAESRARTLDTAAAIARQRSRTPALPTVAAFAVSVASGAAWLATHVVALGIAAVVAVIVALALGAAFGAAARRRDQAIARAENAAAEAAQTSATALALLEARCRNLGCASITAVRAARTAQVDLDRVRAERAAANEAATLLTGQRDALQRRFADMHELDAERVAAQSRADERREALIFILDEIGIESGAIEQRIAVYRRLRDAGEDAARADTAVESARTAIERALRGATIESLEEDATRFAADAASGGDPGEFADRTETDLAWELELLDTQLRDAERALADAHGRIAEFDRSHPVPAAELEERAAATARTRDRLKAAKLAAETAWKAIEDVKDVVHRDFTPTLNAAVGKSAAAITGGRYVEAFIDPANFIVRVGIPETGGTLEAEALSTGTIEQFQFALRAALAAALGSGERVPILFDDALAHADGDRVKAALARAAALAREGEQIVFFTQRADVEEFAAAYADVRLVRLAGPMS